MRSGGQSGHGLGRTVAVGRPVGPRSWSHGHGRTASQVTVLAARPQSVGRSGLGLGRMVAVGRPVGHVPGPRSWSHGRGRSVCRATGLAAQPRSTHQSGHGRGRTATVSRPVGPRSWSHGHGRSASRARVLGARSRSVGRPGPVRTGGRAKCGVRAGAGGPRRTLQPDAGSRALKGGVVTIQRARIGKYKYVIHRSRGRFKRWYSPRRTLP
jgi:hypothetical protein